MTDHIRNGGETFSVSAMLAAGSTETGLDDFGDEEFREALTRLVDSTNREMDLSPIGVMAFKGEVHRSLVNRLRFAADLKRHPEILGEEMDDPIIVTGLPRTGSTKLQRMMAADPDTHGLRFWQMMNPAPFANAIAGAEDPRIEHARQAVSMLLQISPGFAQSHPAQFDDVDEEVFLQLHTFKCMLTSLSHPAPAYGEWLKRQPMQGTYRYMKQLLQYLQWQNGGRRGKPWILKSPVHLAHLDLLLDLFPKATVVVTHRHLHDAIPSFCRLMENSWGIKIAAVDKHAVGRLALDLWPNELREHLRVRDALGKRLNIIDVQYRAIKDDAMEVIGDVYRKAGRELTPQRRQAMLGWEAQNPQHQQGSYSYRLEDYGLTRAGIDSAFSDYLQRFPDG